MPVFLSLYWIVAEADLAASKVRGPNEHNPVIGRDSYPGTLIRFHRVQLALHDGLLTSHNINLLDNRPTSYRESDERHPKDSNIDVIAAYLAAIFSLLLLSIFGALIAHGFNQTAEIGGGRAAVYVFLAWAL